MKIVKDENGGSLIEFALIAPILFLILFGIIEFGLILYNQAVLTNASREGARYGILMQAPPRHTQTEIAAEVISACQNNLITFGQSVLPSVSANPADGSGSYGGDLAVTVTWYYNFLVLPNFSVGALTNPLLLSARTVMKYE